MFAHTAVLSGDGLAGAFVGDLGDLLHISGSGQAWARWTGVTFNQLAWERAPISGITQYLSFCTWLLSLSMTCSSAVACVSTSFFFKAE